MIINARSVEEQVSEIPKVDPERVPPRVESVADGRQRITESVSEASAPVLTLDQRDPQPVGGTQKETTRFNAPLFELYSPESTTENDDELNDRKKRA
jgi:hypothetical protein